MEPTPTTNGALGGRPVLMERYPNGAGGPSFFQKRVPANAPDWLQTTTVQTPNGTRLTVSTVRLGRKSAK